MVSSYPIHKQSQRRSVILRRFSSSVKSDLLFPVGGKVEEWGGGRGEGVGEVKEEVENRRRGMWWREEEFKSGGGKKNECLKVVKGGRKERR